ncbi:MAG: hypothetical protein K2O24_03335 [Muribaculaceae bacterium]|nr:hypothetical protein [Muribaculaceae bacterium]
MKKSIYLSMAFALAGASALTAAIAGSLPVAMETVAETGDIAWTMDPADGSTVADASTVTISFPGATEVKLGDEPMLTASWNGADVAADFITRVINNEVVISKYPTSMTDFTGEATFVATLRAGSVIVDGVASPAISFTLHQGDVQGGETGESVSFMSILDDSYPVVNSFIETDDVMSVVYFNMTRSVTLNKECTSPAVLKLQNKEIASISAASSEGDSSWATVAGTRVELDFTKADLEENGVYKVEIPAGFLKCGGDDVAAATLYYIKGVGTFTPAAGSVIDVTDKPWSSLSFTPYSVVELYEITGESESKFGTDEPMTITLDGKVIESFPIEQQMIFRSKMSLSFVNKITEPGEYKLNIPANYFMATLDGVTVGNPAMTEIFTIEGSAAPEMTYTLSPAPGQYKVYPTVKLTYDNYDSIEVTEGAKAKLKVVNTDYITFTITAEGNTVIFTPDAEFSQYIGNVYTDYELIVPADSYKLIAGGKSWPNEALNIIDYKIAPPAAPAFEIDPEDGATVESLDEIILAPAQPYNNTQITTFKKAKLFEVEDGVRGAQICTMSATAAPGNTKEYVTLTLPNTVESLEDGDYELVVPAGAFTFNVNGVPGIQSPEMVFHYHVGAPAPKELTWTLDPENGATVEDVTTMTITFTDATEVVMGNAPMLTADWNGTDVAGEFYTRIVDNKVVISKSPTSMVFFTGNGTLTAALGAGSVIVDGIPSPEIAYILHQEAKTAGDFEWTAEPADGSSVQNIGDFTILFGSNFLGIEDEEAVKFYWNDEEYDGYEWFGYTDNNDGVIFQLKSGVKAPEGKGTLKVVIGSGFAMLMGANGEEPNPEFVYTLNQTNFAWTADPANGATVSELGDITFRFDSNFLGQDDEEAVKYFWNGEPYDGYEWYGYTDENDGVIFMLKSGVTAPEGEGTLTIVFEEGFLMFMGENGVEPNPEFVYTLNQKPVVGPQPGEPVAFLSIVEDSYPVLNSIINSEDVMSVVYFNMNREVTLNTECADPAVLKFKGKEVASISAGSVEGDDSWATVSGTRVELDFTKAELTDDGKYTVEIPAGFLKCGESDVEAVTLTYVKGLGTFTPAPGDIDVSEKPWTSLSFVPNAGIELYEITGESESTFGTDQPMTITLDGKVIESFPIEQQMIFRGKMSLSFSNRITEPGEYHLNIPANYFMTTIDGATVGNPDMVLNYSVKGAAAPAMTYTLSPAPGEYKVYPTVKLTYINYETIEVVDGAKATLHVMNDDYITFTITAEGNTVTFTPDAEFSQYLGNIYTPYELIVPEGSYNLCVGGRSWPNEALNIMDYRIAAPAAPEFETDPEDGATVESLTEIILAPAQPYYNTGIRALKKAKLYKVEDGVRGDLICSLNATEAPGNTKEYVILTLPAASQALEDGDYEMVVPAGAFSFVVNGVPGIQNPELVFHWTVKSKNVGVAGIFADETVTVYTMTGVCVLRNANAEELGNLAKGLYIINGRKVMVK